jgi:NodT family efflux transporter outer membrane factor (OMF) lipoprotein
VFGANRRQVESLDAQAQYQRFELEATYLSLVANVVGAAIQEASVRAQIAATQAIIADNQAFLSILRDKLANGYAMRLDVAAQEAALGQALQLLPPLQKQLEQTRDLIRVLAGRLPNEDVAETFQLEDLKLPGQVPLSLPSKIIEQRPDVRAAEEQLRATNAQVGVALANRLPQFSITGAVGGNASVFSQMFSSGGPFWDIIGSASQTIFDGNTLLHQQRAAEQALKQSAALYRSTMLSAYQNVADTLHAMLADADALGAAVVTERAAKEERDLTKTRRDEGYTDYLAELTAEMTYQNAVLGLAQAQAQRLGDTAALYQSLGGGWWNRPAGAP